MGKSSGILLLQWFGSYEKLAFGGTGWCFKSVCVLELYVFSNLRECNKVWVLIKLSEGNHPSQSQLKKGYMDWYCRSTS